MTFRLLSVHQIKGDHPCTVCICTCDVILKLWHFLFVTLLQDRSITSYQEIF